MQLQPHLKINSKLHHQCFDMNQYILLFPLLFFPLLSCSQQEQISLPISEEPKDKFSPPIDLGKLENKALDEASGIAASSKYSAALWTHNDSGAEPILFLIDTTGSSLASFYVTGVGNRDWEDIAIGPGPEAGESYLYIGEIGDNQAAHDSYKIYRFKEPTIKEGNTPALDTIQQVDIIEFVYPDGARDAETLMIDPLTKDLYIVSKRDKFEHIYRAPFPQSTSEVITLENTGKLPIKIGGILDQIVGGDISADGREVVLKSYVRVFYWKREDESTSITELLQKEPVVLPYTVEPQGEAIGFAIDGSGYFTLSEKQSGAEPHLYFYKRKKP